MAFPMFGSPYEVEIPKGDGDHGGADPVMLDDIFLPEPPPDPFRRAASHIDGAASILLGISANESMRTGSVVQVDQRLPGDDMLAVLPVHCPECATNGTLVLAYGPEAAEEDSEVLAALPDVDPPPPAGS